MERREITEMVIGSLWEVLQERGEQNKFQKDDLTESSSLIGRESILDSMGLVSLIINIEPKFADREMVITLADERAMSQSKSPFRTVGSLAEYISLLVDEIEN